MFVDSVTLTLSSGKGGSGCSSFRREKFVVKGGPDGGDGGRGGDVVFCVDNNTDTLSWYKGRKQLLASNGRPGEGRNMTGKSGEALLLSVPPGTQVIDDETDEVLLDLLDEGDKTCFLQGGKGGLGNTHFKNSRNQRPTYFQPGLPGQTRKVRLELKLIADVGLVGYPNVGKSTLISTLSNSKAQVANYEFTTLTPKLGVVNVDEYHSFVMADIPGIIDGASMGKGLGLDFLKHIQRTKTLLFMLDVSHQRSIMSQYCVLKEEVKQFSVELSGRLFAIALTKTDLIYKEDLQEEIQEFIQGLGLDISQANRFSIDSQLPYFIQEDDYGIDSTQPLFILPLSCATHFNTVPLTYALYALTGQTS